MEINKIDVNFIENEINYFLLCSDLHLDDIQSDKKRILYDFGIAKNNNARIFINGDLFSAITKQDLKRYSQANDKYNRDDVLDCIVEETFDFLKPYVNLIDIIGTGNHEVSILKYHSTDLTRRIIKELNSIRDKNINPIKHGGYEGFIILQGKFYKMAQRNLRFNIFYNHGQGGTAPVTKGMIDLSRYSYVDSDIIWLGHKHQRIISNMDSLLRLTEYGKPVYKERIGIITGCYLKNDILYDIEKQGYRQDYGEEKMRTPQARGGVLLKLVCNKQSNKFRKILMFT